LWRGHSYPQAGIHPGSSFAPKRDRICEIEDLAHDVHGLQPVPEGLNQQAEACSTIVVFTAISLKFLLVCAMARRGETASACRETVPAPCETDCGRICSIQDFDWTQLAELSYF
jgi:hypothetical protein